MLLYLEEQEKRKLVNLLEECLEEWEAYRSMRHARQPDNWEERLEAAQTYQDILNRLD